MVRANISINLSLKDAEEYELAIAQTQREYNILTNKAGKRCTKGKAFMALIRRGRDSYGKMVDEQFEMIKKQKTKMESVD